MRLRLPQQGAEALEAIAFGYVGSPSDDANSSGGASLSGGARIQLAYRLEVNEYRGTARVQLNCQHLKIE